jgi:hypothetical protein
MDPHLSLRRGLFFHRARRRPRSPGRAGAPGAAAGRGTSSRNGTEGARPSRLDHHRSVLAENASPDAKASAVRPLARHAPARSRHRCTVWGAAPAVFLEETAAMPSTVHPAKAQRKNAGSCSAYHHSPGLRRPPVRLRVIARNSHRPTQSGRSRQDPSGRTVRLSGQCVAFGVTGLISIPSAGWASRERPGCGGHCGV